MTAWTPGRYLRARREKAGKTLADVAAVIGTAPHVPEPDRIALLARVEADEIAIELPIAAAMLSVFTFDPRVLVALVPPLGPVPPRLCRHCGCSEHDACGGPRATSRAGIGCCWVTHDECSACVGPATATAVAA